MRELSSCFGSGVLEQLFDEFTDERQYDLMKVSFARRIDEYAERAAAKELKELLAKLGCKPFDLVRQKEELFLKKFKNKKFSDAEWIHLLCEHPILIERPIVVDGYKAIIGRPPSLVLDLIKRKK